MTPTPLTFEATGPTTGDPHRQPATYRRTADIRLVLLPGAAHCHKQASNGVQLRDRVGAPSSQLTRTVHTAHG